MNNDQHTNQATIFMNFNHVALLVFAVFAISCKTEQSQKSNISGKPINEKRDSVHLAKIVDRIHKEQDSICTLGPKYQAPIRVKIIFPKDETSKAIKKAMLRKAILKPEGDSESGLYNYYFKQKIYDYDTATKDYAYPKVDPLEYKLKDVFVFDINNDGIKDIIHYPGLYRAAMTDFDAFDIFLQQKNSGYRTFTFGGFITDINFGPSNEIKSFTTYEGPCCDFDSATFKTYSLNKSRDDFVLDKAIGLHLCQLIEPKK